MIRKYCKAYYFKDLRQFTNWTEKREEGESDLTDEDVVYLWDDFVVVRVDKNATDLSQAFFE
jgi:hypothetical protein